jgi:2-iminobutanoate/2-iminopropanoate deaminase
MTTTYGPYTPVRSAGNLLFISGQVGVDPVTKEAHGSISQQTKQALLNMKNTLEEAGAEMHHIVKTTIYLTDMDNFAAMNAAYEEAFMVPRPARSTVGVGELPRVGGVSPILVEIEAVAYKEVLA